MATALPETIGNFRILSKLGQGGMGAVFRAVHGTLERPVALKILPAEFANNPEYVMRFLREARTVATLRHENVVQVYDAGEQSGQYYIAMELVDGCNLMKYVEDTQKVPEADGLDLLLQSAKGLAAAHAKGLVHRDIKPENLLLGTDKVLRIVDFGLVMESTSTTQLTATGACLGTPMYMSPEQADGEVADVRTDIYSLGITFFRVFTGQAPFTSPTVMNLLFKHKFEAPPSPKALRPDLSENTSFLLLRMMAKRREDRPQTAQQLAEMIEGMKQGKAIPPPVPFVSAVSGATSMTVVGATPNLSGRTTEPGVSASTTTSTTTQKPSGKVLALVGVVVLALVGLSVILVAGNRNKGSSIDGTASQKPDLIGKGDVAFAAGKYSDALEHYREAKIAEPNNSEVAERIKKAERKLKFTEIMDAAEAFETRGELEDAHKKYAEASLHDDGTLAREKMDRVKASLDQATKLDSAGKIAERDSLGKKAADEEKAQRYAQAAELYARAAALSTQPMRSMYADKAASCRNEELKGKALELEEKGDLPGAKAMYEKSLAIKPDSVVQRRTEWLTKKIKDQETAADLERSYADAMKQGQTAMESGDLAKAKWQFGIATGLKPTQPEPQQKLKQVAARELIAKGDASRGTPATAIGYYNDAMKEWPQISAEAQARIRALQGGTAPVNSDALKKVDALVREEKDTQAMGELASAIRSDPANRELKDAKVGLEGLQACADIYSETEKIIEAAKSRIRDARDIDDDSRSREYKETFETLATRFTELARKPRPLFLERNYEGINGCIDTARKDARQLGDELRSAADTYDNKADKSGEKAGISILGRKIGVGDSKTAEKYRSISSGFRKLAEQARNLGK